MQHMMCFSLPQLLALLMYPAVSSLLTSIIWHFCSKSIHSFIFRFKCLLMPHLILFPVHSTSV
jgi:hypothetical protein